MSLVKPFLLGLSLALTTLPGNGLASTDEDKVAIRTELQIAMQRHVDRSLTKGVLLDLDIHDGEVKKYYPTAAHPLIMKGPDFFVLCADLADDDGNTFDVDYYLTPTERGYKVIRTEVDNRDVLKVLISSGLVKKY